MIGVVKADRCQRVLWPNRRSSGRDRADLVDIERQREDLVGERVPSRCQPLVHDPAGIDAQR